MEKILTTQEVSAGGLIISKDKQSVLMIEVKNLQGKIIWTFPKGHQEEGETLPMAALREVQEETGWKCEIIELENKNNVFYQARYFFHSSSKNKIEKRVTWFLMTPIEKTGEFDPREVQQVSWESLAQAQSKVVYDSDKKLIELLQNYLQTA